MTANKRVSESAGDMRKERLEGMQRTRAWTLRVRPILASHLPAAEKAAALMAEGCSRPNAEALSRMTAAVFDRTNNSALRNREIARLQRDLGLGAAA